jgi:hypothetical protein
LPPPSRPPLSCSGDRNCPGCFDRAFGGFGPAAMTRLTILTASAAEGLFWLYLVVLGLDDALPFAKGLGGTAAFLATVVFVAFVLPALLLALAGRGLQLAACLSSIAAILYLYDPFLRLASTIDGPALLACLGAGLVLAAGAAWYAASRRAEPMPLSR